MLSTGPFIQFCLPYGEKFVNLIVNEKNNNIEDIEDEATAIA